VAFDLQPTDEQHALRDTLRSFARDVIRPQARAVERSGATPDDLLRQIHEIGVTAPVAEEFGGGGTFDAITYCLAAEELAWGDPGIAFDVLGAGLAAMVLGEVGDDAQRASLLPAFAQNEPIASFVAVGEKFAAGDLENLDTVVDGDKAVGEKYGVTRADRSEFGIVVGRNDGELGAVVVRRDAFEVMRAEDKLGLNAAPTFVVRFDGTGEALDPDRLLRGLLWTKLAMGAVALGCARAAFEYASEYATEREAFGRPIGAFQAISFKVADMAIEVDAARMALWRVAWKLDRGKATLSDAAEAVGQAVGAAVRAGDDAVQILGGHGYVQDHPVEMWFRDAVTLSVFDAPEVLGDLMVSRSIFV
jgi:alkylation response protein AidB-like acyl-CoA dehydrogenase